MDVYCRRCGEPWDNDTFHDEADARGNPTEQGYLEVIREFRQKGCVALTAYTSKECEPTPPSPDDSGKLSRAEAASIIYELAGDDMDGAASDFDTAEFLGLME